MMLPAGGVKGAMVAMMVELLCCALTGAHMGFEVDSFFVADGNQPRIGQAFLAVDPDSLTGSSTYFERIETLFAAMGQVEGVRIPGRRREALAERARVEGVSIPNALLAQLRELAGRT